MATYEGGCECGAVRYRMTDDPVFVSCCHCRQCQKMTGSAFAINGMIEAERLEILHGGDELSKEGGQVRCAKCNTLLWANHRQFGDNLKFVRLGTLAKPSGSSPTRISSPAASTAGWRSLTECPPSNRYRPIATRR